MCCFVPTLLIHNAKSFFFQKLNENATLLQPNRGHLYMISFTEPCFFDSDKSQHSPFILPHIFPWHELNIISFQFPLGLVSSVGQSFMLMRPCGPVSFPVLGHSLSYSHLSHNCLLLITSGMKAGSLEGSVINFFPDGK